MTRPKKQRNSVACLLAALATLACAQDLRADPASVALTVKTPEEAVAFFLFGAGFQDICRAAYADTSCPIRLLPREIRVTDAVYEHHYRLSSDGCTVDADLRNLKTGEHLIGKFNFDGVRAIDATLSSNTGKSLEYAFVFSGEATNQSPGQATGSFTLYHEYHSDAGSDLNAHAQAELVATRSLLERFQQQDCFAAQ